MGREMRTEELEHHVGLQHLRCTLRCARVVDQVQPREMRDALSCAKKRNSVTDPPANKKKQKDKQKREMRDGLSCARENIFEC